MVNATPLSEPGSGSFIRPRKVTTGYSFIEALRKVILASFYWQNSYNMLAILE